MCLVAVVHCDEQAMEVADLSDHQVCLLLVLEMPL